MYVRKNGKRIPFPGSSKIRIISSCLIIMFWSETLLWSIEIVSGPTMLKFALDSRAEKKPTVRVRCL